MLPPLNHNVSRGLPVFAKRILDALPGNLLEFTAEELIVHQRGGYLDDVLLMLRVLTLENPLAKKEKAAMLRAMACCYSDLYIDA